jgi:hypothetical protein
MKIIIISRARTRSSYLQQNLAFNYGLTNLGERLGKASYAYSPSLNMKYMFNKGDINDLRFQHYQKLLVTITKDFFDKDNFVVKLFPRMLLSFPQQITGKIEDYRPNIVTNLTECIKLQEYDKIYFLDRELTDSACSWIYATITKNFLFFEGDRLYHDHIKKYNTITITEKYFSILDYYIYEMALQQEIKKFLISKNIQHTSLDYYDIPNYVSNNCNKISNVFKNSNFDYTQKITNYTEINDYINHTYCMAKLAIQDVVFK